MKERKKEKEHGTEIHGTQGEAVILYVTYEVVGL